MLVWLPAALLALVLAWFFQARRGRARLVPESLFAVTFDEREIAVADPGGGVHRVTWDAITRVGIRTTCDGPFRPDVFWGIHAGGEEPALVFPGGASGETELLAELQRRLPRFDNDQLIVAMGSTSDAYFLLWG